MFARFLQKNLLPLVILAGILCAVFLSDTGRFLHGLHLVGIMTMIIFFCQGLGFDAKGTFAGSSWMSTLGIGALVNQGLAPVLAVGATLLLGWQGDQRVGLILICCMAPTLVSGTVIAVSGGGERGTSLLLTVVINIVAIVLIPLNLKWALGASVELDQWALLTKLILYVLIPSVIGQAVRWQVPKAASFKDTIKYLPVVLLGLTIFLSLSMRIDRISNAGIRLLAGPILPSLAVHYILFVTIWLICSAVRTRRESKIAASFVCSQKTIPVAIIVWQQVLATHYPMAIIPAVVFHLSQVYGDGLLAHWFARKESMDA